jgi:hypothetical protein
LFNTSMQVSFPSPSISRCLSVWFSIFVDIPAYVHPSVVTMSQRRGRREVCCNGPFISLSGNGARHLRPALDMSRHPDPFDLPCLGPPPFCWRPSTGRYGLWDAKPNPARHFTTLAPRRTRSPFFLLSSPGIGQEFPRWIRPLSVSYRLWDKQAANDDARRRLSLQATGWNVHMVPRPAAAALHGSQ